MTHNSASGRSHAVRARDGILAAATWLDQIRSEPTLLIVGKEDITFIFDVAKALQFGIPNLTRFDMPGTAHLPPMEKPEEFNRVVGEFFGGK